MTSTGAWISLGVEHGDPALPDCAVVTPEYRSAAERGDGARCVGAEKDAAPDESRRGERQRGGGVSLPVADAAALAADAAQHLALRVGFGARGAGEDALGLALG